MSKTKQPKAKQPKAVEDAPVLAQALAPTSKKAPLGAVKTEGVQAPKATETKTPKAAKEPKPEKAVPPPLPRGLIEKPKVTPVTTDQNLTFVVVFEQETIRSICISRIIPCTVQVSPVDKIPYVWAHPGSGRDGYVWKREFGDKSDLIGYEFATIEDARTVAHWLERIMLARQDSVSLFALEVVSKLLGDEDGEVVNEITAWGKIARQNPHVLGGRAQIDAWYNDHVQLICPPNVEYKNIIKGCVTSEGKVQALCNAWSLYLATTSPSERAKVKTVVDVLISEKLAPWGCSLDEFARFTLAIDREIEDHLKERRNPWSLDVPKVEPVQIQNSKEIKKPKKKAA